MWKSISFLFPIYSAAHLVLASYDNILIPAPSASFTSFLETESGRYVVSEKRVASIVDGVTIAGIGVSNASNFFDQSEGQAPRPITIINHPNLPGRITRQWLDSTFEYMLSDDVFAPVFLASVLFAVNKKIQQTPDIPEVPIELLDKFGVNSYSFLILEAGLTIPTGPYFLQGSSIYEALKLYPDPYGAFVYGVTQTDDGFKRFFTDMIPVPSRLYANKTTAKYLPLAGKRVAVKDIIDLKGLPTGASSKAFAAFHGPAKKTAAAVQKLIDLGAVVVGKTKTTQFANGETARDWIELQCPFNPRADGYLDPAGSSTGSGAAVAGYEWVDYALGTDTCGSIIWPAALQGIFGLRPTLGVSELDGVMPASSIMDTIGFFARDINNFKLFQEVWYDQKKNTCSTKLTRIIVPWGVLDPLSRAKKSVISKFAQDMAEFGSLSKIDLDIDKVWRSSGFTLANTSYTDYLYSTVAHIQIWDSHAHEFKFFEDYQKKFGIYPYIDPMVLHKWDFRANISTSEYKEAIRRKMIFKKFLDTNIFQDGAIMILPAGSPEPSYRDELIPPESIDVYLQSFGFDNTFYSILGGLPSVVVPVGQRSITSKVTKGKVWEPVSVMIVGSEGTEGQIIELVRLVLKKSRRPMGVKVGDAAF
ncbi:hypothetical protein H072_10674 [Dactylellina haptotyla CBS 200.50]|uniref:Amidase domain-containing protein n=1 Tax=Dactylellina haptotyla (strain CBS 200.50) TaxID=1284197 RepID=S8B9Y0_DACHA|nr:hypothetical protein H072_10674 [Dactylellina haptotyla CBS 200.50]